jgi:uncharacterized membrane protein required for colicin V production
MKDFLDISTVVIILAVIWINARKGFLRSLAELAGFVVSLAAAAVFSAPAGEWLYTHFIRAAFRGAVASYINSFADKAGQGIAALLAEYKIDSHAAVSAAQSVGSAVSGQSVSGVADPLGEVIGRGAAFILIFIVCLAAAGLIARALGHVNRLPILGGMNRFGGALLGAVTAVLLIFALCTLTAALIPVFAMQSTPPISDAVIAKTDIFRHFYDVNPFKGILFKS